MISTIMNSCMISIPILNPMILNIIGPTWRFRPEKEEAKTIPCLNPNPEPIKTSGFGNSE